MDVLITDLEIFLKNTLKNDQTKIVPDLEPETSYLVHAKTYLPKTTTILLHAPAPFPIRKVLSSFIVNGCTDDELPYDDTSLTAILERPHLRSLFLKAQARVLVEEIPEGQHREYGPFDFVPFAKVHDCQPRGGAFGTVTKVESVRDRAKVYACKELKLEPKEESEAVWGYQLELENLAGLSHPHMIKLICSYTKNHSAYIIMSPYAALNLLDFMKSPSYEWYASKNGKEQRNMILDWMTCLASALVYLHDQRMKHKDIKPDNILLDVQQGGTPTPLLADFGISKRFALSQGSRSLGRLGTEFWQSPEQMCNKKAGRAVDIFALGGIYLLLLALGHGNSIQKIIDELKRGKVVPGFASNLEDVVLPYLNEMEQAETETQAAWILTREMLMKNPDDRPKARDVWKTLKGVMEEQNFRPHCNLSGPTPDPSTESGNGDDDTADTTAFLARLRLERQSSSSSWFN